MGDIIFRPVGNGDGYGSGYGDDYGNGYGYGYGAVNSTTRTRRA